MGSASLRRVIDRVVGTGGNAAPVEGPVALRVRGLLEDAIRRGASDLHLDPRDGSTRCRMRVDGRFEEGEVIEGGMHERIASRLKVMAGLPVYRHDEIQEGAIRLDGGVDVRLSIVPTIAGEKVTLRIFDPATRPFRLDDLAFRDEIAARLRALASRADGTILLCGPSGAGKTTTAYALLERIRRERGDHANLCSVEDPVEFALEGIHQVPVRREHGLTFPRALATLLRQDPDVLLVGEVRDAETARIAIEAGMTGHLVLTSLHAGSAGEALTRLLDLGLEPRLVTSSVRAIVAQRLVRTVCGTCAGAGCASCRGSGHAGRTPVAEMLEMDREVAAAFAGGEDAGALNERLVGGRALIDDARDLVRRGVTTAAELDRVFGPGRAVTA